jgi:hypothetical protein
MKMKLEHFTKLKAACLEVLRVNPNAYQDYKNAGLSDKRFNFDVMHAATIDGQKSNRFVCDVLYKDGLNDTHIGTALKLIMGNSGLGANGKP